MSALFRSPLSSAPSSLPFTPDALGLGAPSPAETRAPPAAEEQPTDDPGRSSSAGTSPAYGDVNGQGLPVTRAATTAQPESSSADLSSSRQADRSTGEVRRSELALLPARDSGDRVRAAGSPQPALATLGGTTGSNQYGQGRPAAGFAQNTAVSSDRRCTGEAGRRHARCGATGRPDVANSSSKFRLRRDGRCSRSSGISHQAIHATRTAGRHLSTGARSTGEAAGRYQCPFLLGS
jgi:hypothetical protein